MGTKNYWLDLFTPQTWREFLDAGGKTSGFRESRWSLMQKMQKGDYLLCYLTGVSRWVGLLEVTSEPYKDSKQIWKDDVFPCRVHVKQLVTLTPETGIPVQNMRDVLSAFKGPHNEYSLAWTGKFRGSPTKWSQSDGEAVVEALHDAQKNPITRPIHPAKLKYRPKTVEAKIGLVTVPESDSDAEISVPGPKLDEQPEPTAHTEIQSLVLKLGSDMGFDVWVARNDRGRNFLGKRLGDYPRMKATLPLQFDDATNRTIELIDVLWLQGNAIVAAFEIESTTSIYSGLLRMADLLSMQPNLNIPLYLVAPDERREKVLEEVNRPTFSRLSPKLCEMCRFIAFSALRERLQQVQEFVRFLKPDFLEELSESCDVSD